MATGMSSAARAMSARMLRVGPAEVGRKRCASASMAPESCKPWPSTSTQATVITAGWPNPE
ncbi:MAG: hypothetical protein RQ936_12595, partial [Gammaproteobacteria bacterium]|nr:hypothetical protein [Gammaproteobacteria bacterium]